MGLLDRFFGPPSRDKFAKMMMDAIRQAGEQRPLVYDKDEFRLIVEGPDGQVANLHNAYPEYCDAPPKVRPEVLAGYVRTFFASQIEIPEDYEDASHDLMPIVRTPGFFDGARLGIQLAGTETGKSPSKLVFQPLNDYLGVGLAYDLPAAMKYIDEDQLNKWNVSQFQALETARHNLEQLGELGWAKIGSGFYSLLAGDDYNASRLICLDLIRSMEVQGDLVAAVPNRGSLLLTGTEDDEGLRIMGELVEKGFKEDTRPISGILFRLCGDEWLPWLPDPSHPQYERFKILEYQSIGHEYAGQKELLEQLHQKAGDDVFVASYNAFHSQGGEFFSHCIWPNGVRALLPRTEKVAFVRSLQDRAPVYLPWDRVTKVVGDLMEPQGMQPERWHVNSFPTEEQLTAMTQLG